MLVFDEGLELVQCKTLESTNMSMQKCMSETEQYSLTNYKVIYIGKERLCLIPGETYEAHDIRHNSRLVGVFDESKEWYAYPKRLFKKVE